MAKEQDNPQPTSGAMDKQDQERQRPTDARPPDARSPDAPTQGRAVPHIPPFVVECGDYKSSGLITVDSIKQRLRGRWDRANLVGEGSLPNRLPTIIPGIQLRLNPRDQKLTVYDPLTDKPELREEIERAQNNDQDVTIRDATGAKVKPWPTVEHSLNQHELKSLLLEISRKTGKADEELNAFILIKGEVPSEEILANYPGRELYDPWSSNPRKPKFKDQADAWLDTLDHATEFSQ